MQHENLDVSFTGGLQVVRGANEAGKSTLLLGAAYALYGTKVLPETLSQVVTWGKDEKDLKVRLVVEVDGKPYTFVRGKSGAEVVVDGKVFVTGQTEVSNFATQLLGADATTAAILMLSPQGSLRGTLDAGPKATSLVIEQLADFDLFDRLLEAAAEKLSLGAPTVFEERLKGQRAQLDLLEMPAKPDEVEFGTLSRGYSEAIADSDANLKKANEDFLVHYRAWKDEYERRGRRDEIEREIAQYRTQQESTRTKLKAEWYLSNPSTGPLEDEIVLLKKAVEEQKGFALRLKAYQTFAAFQPFRVRLPAPLKDVESSLRASTNRIANLRTDIASMRGEVKTLEARRVTSSTCGFCHQDVSQFPEVARLNAEIAEKVAAKGQEIEKAESCLEADKAHKDTFEALIEAQRKVEALIKTLGTNVEVDETCTPNGITWAGSIPSNGPSPDYAKDLRECEDKVTAMRAAKARAQAYEGVISEAEVKVGALTTEITNLNLVSEEAFQVLEASYLEAGEAVRLIEADIIRNKDILDALSVEFAQRMGVWGRAAETQTRITQEIADTEKALSDLAFNNNLVKKIRAARPNVATRMWNLVLASVSTLFTQMRGEKSVVTKANGGFSVNGQSVATLSGSTKDILGLATRVALIKTFLPGCPFLVLDEPSQGCDSDRTGALLGFIASCGFSQVILVTHDGLSESFADNLISL
jgi:DNA repair exonuclease SbcCD ATPase subunit